MDDYHLLFRFRCRECPFAGREGLWLTEMRLRVAQALGVGQARVRVGLVWHSETHNADLVVTRSCVLFAEELGVLSTSLLLEEFCSAC